MQILNFAENTNVGGAIFNDNFSDGFVKSNLLDTDVIVPIININNYKFSSHNSTKVQFLEQVNDHNISRSLINMTNGEYVEIIIELPKDLSKGSELDNQIINEIYTILKSINYAQ